MMYGVKRTTIYLPDNLKRRLSQVAQAEGTTEAEVIRNALSTALQARAPAKPRLPLFEPTGATSDWAERIDEVLAETGFGH